MAYDFRQGDALIIIDVQNDFCPGGALPIPDGDAVVPVLNAWIGEALAAGVPVYASRDWHPLGHISFTESGGQWPPHCIQDTEGAHFHLDLALPHSVVKVTKGVRFDHDQNSAFDETGLSDKLRRDGISGLWIGGLAQDVCVLATALDARKEGFEVGLIEAGTRPVTPEGGTSSLQKLRSAGVRIVS